MWKEIECYPKTSSTEQNNIEASASEVSKDSTPNHWQHSRPFIIYHRVMNQHGILAA
jgi:hypothetical protein